MRVTELDTFSRTQRLLDVNATVQLAGVLSEHVRQGDVICLTGALGAGKTTFARAFINAIALRSNEFEEEVPSPTFTLVQTYEFSDLVVSHFDFYRIERSDEVFELGLEEAIDDGIALLEWPESLGYLLPTNRLGLALRDGSKRHVRIAELTGYGSWAKRLAEIPKFDRA